MTGHDEQGVDADVVFGPGIARGKLLGRRRDPAQPIMIERQAGRVRGGALLHLDEGDDLSATGDDIDFAAANPGAPGEDTPAVEPKPPCGQRLGPASANLGQAAVQSSPPSSRARA